MTGAISHSIRRFFQTSSIRAATPIRGPSGSTGTPDGGYKIYKYLSLFVGFPAIIGCAVYCFISKRNEPAERPPFVKYEYLRIRTKRFPWGDGNHTLFHNPHVNPLPDGYEDGENEPNKEADEADQEKTDEEDEPKEDTKEAKKAKK